MALYSKVNSLVQYSRVSFDLNPRPEVVNFLYDLLFPSGGRAFVAISTFLNASSKLFSLARMRVTSTRAGLGVDFFSFGDRNWVARLSLGFSWRKVAHACRLEKNYVESSLPTP